MKHSLFNIILGLSLIITGCIPAEYAGTSSLADLERLGTAPVYGRNRVDLSRIRFTALQEIALTLGAQAGLAWRANQINKELSSHVQDLDETYNFNSMMLSQNVLPPVLSEADNSLNLTDTNTIRLASKTYKIITQAHFVSTPPTWRDYLWMNFQKPDAPDRALLPKNREEQKVWKHFVAEGWQNGINQANDIFSANLARLKRDFTGMALYKELYAQNMVSAPFVAKTELGITGDSSEMSINDKVLRITALPQLNLKGNTWKPGLVPENTESVSQITSAPKAPAIPKKNIKVLKKQKHQKASVRKKRSKKS